MTIQINRRHFLSGTVALTGFAALPIWAQPTPQSWPKVQAVLDDYIAHKRVASAGAAIGRGLGPAGFLTSGTLAFGNSLPVTPDTLFRCYSMTKPIVGMATMMLIEEGKLKLDQNIADILPAFANPMVMINPKKDLTSRPAKSPITIRTLLTHTAGLGYTIVGKGPLNNAYTQAGITPFALSRHDLPGAPRPKTAPSLEEFANRLATMPLLCDPGTQWNYSVGLDLMGRIIEIVSGMTFDAFLKARIFDPLGMTSSYFQVPASEAARLTSNYFKTGFGPFPIDKREDSVFLDKPPFAFGGSGLISSMRDYDRFLQMLMGEGALGDVRIMKGETARLAMSNLIGPDVVMQGLGKGQGFGAGGRVTINPDDRGAGIGTYGWGGAASTIAWVDRARGIRASGWSQMMNKGKQPFPADFGKAVYASL